MEKHTQTIINVCLAIFVATTIYNTNQLNDTIDVLKESTERYAQLDIDNVLKRISQNEKDTEYSILIVDRMIDHVELQSEMNPVIVFNERKIKDISESITDIERSIRRLPKPKTTRDIKTIINGCAVPLYNVSVDGLFHGHKKLEC